MKLFSYLNQLYNKRKMKTDKKDTFLGMVLSRINNSPQYLSSEQMNNLFVLLFAYVIVFPELLERELKKCSTETLKIIGQLFKLKLQTTQEIDMLLAQIMSNSLQLKENKILINQYVQQEVFQWALFLAYYEKYKGNVTQAIAEFTKFMKSLNVPVLDKVMSMLDILNRYANNLEVVNSLLNVIKENINKESVQEQEAQKQEEIFIEMPLQPSPKIM